MHLCRSGTLAAGLETPGTRLGNELNSLMMTPTPRLQMRRALQRPDDPVPMRTPRRFLETPNPRDSTASTGARASTNHLEVPTASNYLRWSMPTAPSAMLSGSRTASSVVAASTFI